MYFGQIYLFVSSVNCFCRLNGPVGPDLASGLVNIESPVYKERDIIEVIFSTKSPLFYRKIELKHSNINGTASLKVRKDLITP